MQMHFLTYLARIKICRGDFFAAAEVNNFAMACMIED